jgi:rSAM/selenodomain-associated transferase 2
MAKTKKFSIKTPPVLLPQLSIIIPTLNEADTLHECLKSVVKVSDEIIVVDGGSSDETVSIAEQHNCKTVAAPRGRGQQLAAGAQTATKSWLLFIHADTTLDNSWYHSVSAFIAIASNKKKAAAFEYKNDLASIWGRLLEKYVRIRSRLGLVYGDQGLLIQHKHYCHLGGYTKIPIMEDVDFCRKIGFRNISILHSSAMTSGRRYKNIGVFSRGLRNIVCLSLYFMGLPAETLEKLYGESKN